MLTTLSALDELKGRWRTGIVPGDRLSSLAGAAEVQSIAASCRLSGLRVTEGDVSSVLRGEAFTPHETAGIENYAAALRHPLPGPETILTTEDLGRLNAVLGGARGDSIEPSPWRVSRLHRETFDADGMATGRIHSTLPPRLVAQHTEELLTWLEYELRARKRHPVLIVGAFILGLINASPYERHNSRMARLLVGRLLGRAGYAFMPFASVEIHLEELRPEFHDAVDRSQTRLWSGDADLEPWLTLLLDVLDRHRERIDAKVKLERAAMDYTPLQRAILDAVREHGTVDAGLLLRATNANRNTLKDNLRRLVQTGALEKSGQRRGTRYRLSGAAVLPAAG